MVGWVGIGENLPCRHRQYEWGADAVVGPYKQRGGEPCGVWVWAGGAFMIRTESVKTTFDCRVVVWVGDPFKGVK